MHICILYTCLSALFLLCSRIVSSSHVSLKDDFFLLIVKVKVYSSAIVGCSESLGYLYPNCLLKGASVIPFLYTSLE